MLPEKIHFKTFQVQKLCEFRDNKWCFNTKNIFTAMRVVWVNFGFSILRFWPRHTIYPYYYGYYQRTPNLLERN